MSERLLNQLNKLQKNGPSPQWKENTRNLLVFQVKKDTLTNEHSWRNSLEMFSFIYLKKIVPHSVRAISTLIVIAMMGGVGLFAQAEYIPSRPLYIVKKTLERIELVLSFTQKIFVISHLHIQYLINTANKSSLCSDRSI